MLDSYQTQHTVHQTQHTVHSDIKFCLTIMNNEDTDRDSMITTFNTAMTETASEILGKHRQKKKEKKEKKKTWVNAEILHLCDKRRELGERKKLNLKDLRNIRK